MMLEQWDEKQVEGDIKKFKEMNIKCVRFMPFWHLIQPQPDKLDEKILTRIDKMLDLGQKYGVSFQLAPLTGWMSGGTFLPDWAMGNIFTDKKIIEGEKFLAKEFAKRFGNHPALQSIDFGNEINVLPEVMKLNVTPAEMDAWMSTIYAAFKEGNSKCLVTNGIGTGFTELFHIEAITKSSDYMCVHSYPGSHGLNPYDSQTGLRCLYACNFITEWASMVGKPVLVQENGANTLNLPSFQSSAFLQNNFVSTWAEGAAGYFWWGSHNVPLDYIVTTKGLKPEFSNNDMKNGILKGDKRMGLLTEDNNVTISGNAYLKCSKLIDKLGIGWEDKLPVCYIIVPHTTKYKEAMLRFITPFVIAKEAHFDVKISWEDKPIPSTAACAIISGFALSQSGKTNINTYLQNGGTVYQSFYNDFASNINLSDTITKISKQTLYTQSKEGDLYKRLCFSLYNVAYKKFSSHNTVNVATYGDKSDSTVKSESVFVKTTVEKGTFFFMASNMEESPRFTFNPWDTDESYRIFSALKPASRIYLENKFI